MATFFDPRFATPTNYYKYQADAKSDEFPSILILCTLSLLVPIYTCTLSILPQMLSFFLSKVFKGLIRKIASTRLTALQQFFLLFDGRKSLTRIKYCAKCDEFQSFIYFLHFLSLYLYTFYTFSLSLNTFFSPSTKGFNSSVLTWL